MKAFRFYYEGYVDIVAENQEQAEEKWNMLDMAPRGESVEHHDITGITEIMKMGELKKEEA
jgi:hypothetical protein